MSERVTKISTKGANGSFETPVPIGAMFQNVFSSQTGANLVDTLAALQRLIPVHAVLTQAEYDNITPELGTLYFVN